MISTTPDTQPLALTKWKFMQLPVGDWHVDNNVQFMLHNIDDGCVLYQCIVNGEKMSAKLKSRMGAFVFHKLVSKNELIFWVKG